MDADRMPAMQEAGRKFEHDYGIKVNVDATENIPNNFPLAVQSNKGPDVVIFAHDKLGEWADGGLIAPIPIDAEYRSRFDSVAWEAVRHRGEYWGYPLCFEVVGELRDHRRGTSGSEPAKTTRHSGAKIALRNYVEKQRTASGDESVRGRRRSDAKHPSDGAILGCDGLRPSDSNQWAGNCTIGVSRSAGEYAAAA